MLLKENVITAIIPKLNGYAPLSVTTTGDYIYDEDALIIVNHTSSENAGCRIPLYPSSP